MKIQKISSLVFCFVALSAINTVCIARNFEIWTEEMTCGEARYKLESTCKNGNDEMELNDCKSQTLEILLGRNVRKITLPELSKFSTQIIKNVGGNVKNLFVTKWGCGQSDEIDVAVLHYSIGGGSAPYSESSAIYDGEGTIIEDEKNKKYQKALADSRKHMKKVRSIMPK